VLTLVSLSVHALPTRRSSDLFRQSPKASQKHCADQQNTPEAGVWFQSIADAADLPPRSPVSPDSAVHNPKAQLPVRCHSRPVVRSEEHTSELQSRFDIVCRLL